MESNNSILDEDYLNAFFRSKEVSVFVDGSYGWNGSGGTYACILTDSIYDKDNILAKYSGKIKESKSLNPRLCEMTAIICGIILAVKHGYKSVNVYTDNQDCYFIANNFECNCLAKDWFLGHLNKLKKLCSFEVMHVKRNNMFIKEAHNLCKEKYLDS